MRSSTTGAETPLGGSAVSFLCAILTAYRRACGKLRLWSGGDNQVTNERISRSQQIRSVWSAMLDPGIPCLEAWEEVKSGSLLRKSGRRRLLHGEATSAFETRWK